MTNKINDIKYTKLWLVVITIIAPIAYFNPFISNILTPYFTFDVDVVFFYFNKVYLLDALSNGFLPLWSPGEGCGFPFFSSPHNQALYPLNFLAALYYKYFDGFSKIDYQRFSVLGISLFNVFLFLWLKVLKLPNRAALFAVLIICLSYGLAGTLNRIHATHSMAWIMMIVWGLTLAMHQNKANKGAVVVAIGAWCLITTAYPYYLYYTVFLFPFYIAMLLLKNTQRAFIVGDENFINPKKYLLKILAAFTVPLLIASPYLYKLLQLKNVTAGREEWMLSYAQERSFTLLDALQSWLYPAFANTVGWYYFGLLGTFLIAIYVLNYFVPIVPNYTNKKTLQVVGGYFLGISLITFSNFIVFKVLWYIMPGFASLRTWGRLNVVLLPFIAFLLAKAYQLLEVLLLEPQKVNKSLIPKFLNILAAFSGLVLLFQFIMYWGFTTNDFYWTSFSEKFPTYQPVKYILIAAVYALSLMAIIKMVGKPNYTFLKNKKYTWLLLIALIGVNWMDVGILACKIRATTNDELATQKRKINLKEEQNKFFDAPRNYAIRWSKIYDYKPYSALPGKNWLYNSYTNFVSKQSNLDRTKVQKKQTLGTVAIDRLLGVVDGKKIFFSGGANPKKVSDFVKNSKKFEKKTNFTYKLIKYTGDYLAIEVKTEKEGFLSFIDNWDADWEAKVNGHTVFMSKLFGTFKMVKINEGTSVVQFLYNPFPFSIYRSFPTEKIVTKEQENSTNIDSTYLDLATNKVTWINKMGLGIEKSERGSWGNVGVSSKNELPNGSDGVCLIPVFQNKMNRVIGLAEKDVDAHYNTINYAYYFNANNEVEIIEKGVHKGVFASYEKQDTFSIVRQNAQLLYLKNKKIVYVSNKLSKTKLLVDASFLNINATFLDNELVGIKTSF